MSPLQVRVLCRHDTGVQVSREEKQLKSVGVGGGGAEHMKLLYRVARFEKKAKAKLRVFLRLLAVLSLSYFLMLFVLLDLNNKYKSMH